MQYSNSVYTLLGNIQTQKEQTTEEAKNQNGLSIFDNRTTRAQTSKQQSYQTTQRLKKSMKRLNLKIQKLKLYQRKFNRRMISVLLQVVLPLEY